MRAKQRVRTREFPKLQRKHLYKYIYKYLVYTRMYTTKNQQLKYKWNKKMLKVAEVSMRELCVCNPFHIFEVCTHTDNVSDIWDVRIYSFWMMLIILDTNIHTHTYIYTQEQAHTVINKWTNNSTENFPV